MYIHLDIEVRASATGGYGLFAKESIPAETLIWDNPEVLQPEYIWSFTELSTLDYVRLGKIRTYGYQIDDEYMCGIHRTTLDIADISFFMNHSCDSNCYFDSLVSIRSYKPINRNTELTYDYATTDSHSFHGVMQCNCQSEKCRKFVTPADYLLPEVQAAQRGHFLPHIQTRLSRSAALL